MVTPVIRSLSVCKQSTVAHRSQIYHAPCGRASNSLSGPTSFCFFFFSSRRRHTRCSRDWSSDVCSSDLSAIMVAAAVLAGLLGRRADVLRTLALAALVLALAWPGTPLEIAFQLSFASVAAIVCGMRRLPPPAPARAGGGRPPPPPPRPPP